MLSKGIPKDVFVFWLKMNLLASCKKESNEFLLPDKKVSILDNFYLVRADGRSVRLEYWIDSTRNSSDCRCKIFLFLVIVRIFSASFLITAVVSVPSVNQCISYWFREWWKKYHMSENRLCFQIKCLVFSVLSIKCCS